MTPFVAKATGGARTADRDEVRRALSVLIDPAQTFEIRGLPSGRSRICSGADLDGAVDAAWELSDGAGVYRTLNPVRSDLEKAANDRDILSRQQLLIDSDPIRPANTNATDEERNAAIDRACDIAAFLTDQGWADPVFIDSGNGAHLNYRVDLPNDKLSRQLIRDVLIELAKRFDDDKVKVDRSVHNASRIAKLPGTWARKGPETPDRPHRMARLISVPNSIGVVTVDQLSALVNPPKVKPEVNGHVHFQATATNGTLDAYVRSAIERECARVRWATPGPAEGRNNALNRAAFCLGTMAAWPELIETDAKRSLHAAAIQAGLPESRITRTLQSGWEAGTTHPRERPVEPGRNGVAKPGKQKLKKYTIRLDEVKPEKVDWVWEDRIAVGFISIFAGRTGVGKSFVLCDAAARLSRGEPPPYSSLSRGPVRTLIISEDPVKVMLGPRLIELKADRQMIHFMTWEAMAQFTLDDVAMLNEVYEECGRPGLIVIDPPTNFLGSTDEHKNAEVRNVLMGMVAWLDGKQVACVLITHLNKAVGKGLDAVERIMGSVAWGSVARITIAFVKDPESPGQLLCGGTKNNLGPIAGTLAYRITKTDTLAIIDWVGPIKTSMEEAMNFVKKPNRKIRAIEWIIQKFRERLKWPSSELETLWRAEGISRNGFIDAKNEVGVINEPVRNAAGQVTAWNEWVPSDWKYLNADWDSGDSGTLANHKSNNQTNLHNQSQSTNQTSSMNSGTTIPESQNPKGVSGTQNGVLDPKARALRQLMGLMMGGPIPRDRVVVLAAEAGIPLDVLNQAAKDMGIKSSVENNQEIWSLP
jgi:hypothetical protein